ncbi:polysaccharide export protein [Gemmobacter lutimaris]|uniref:Polysaccharide export protein n=2 Tax=Gemmobacter lutimaris TaxID=2306023 RepID=A0A398BUK3_9RHOB|nr:polysaccharide export protein [Gemmobacter lutimaris]
MRKFALRLCLATASLGMLASCGDLPAGGPNAGQILAGADKEDADFAVYAVTRETLPKFAAWPSRGATPAGGWIPRAKGPSSQIIEAGDMLDLAIWDNGDSSLLTQSGQKVVELKGIRVSPAGEVFLPYVDQVYVAKMSPDRARNTIQAEFSQIIPSAQVQLSHQAGRQSSVDLVSGVTTPGNYVMPDRDFTVLSLIAMGGGIAKDIENPQVRLMRGGKLYAISADRLLKSPSLDTTLRGGDKIYVESDGRYFLSLGATGREAQIPFPHDKVTALDAASLVGGLNDVRANPKSVLILRNYEPSDLRSNETGPSKERVIFALDLTTADGLFSAGEFAVQDRDLVLATQSSLSNTKSIIGLVYDAFGITTRIDRLVK